MHDNVLEHEPHLALFVSNEDPLIFYKAIASFALTNLNPNGKLYFEINEYLGQETVDMLLDKGFENIELRKDMQGKDRMICCQLAAR
ncbi:N5-glutamine S-adenosyl-L-methionine-dependent methyltransferase [compost metagenome]